MDALPQLALLAVAVGVFTGFVILLFRTAIEFILARWVLQGDSEAFETLAYLDRLLLPVAGAAVLGLLLHRLSVAERRVGVVHVLERLSRHQGQMPLRNALIQFFGGIVALISGQSGGREGPAVHLGAASASLLGQAFELPNNSIRTLVACGSAAAIASSFNTPIAGVIFAMEVVVMDYTIAGFIPVIIAAVTSTVLTQYFVGNDPAFSVAPLQIGSLLELPFIVFAGVVIGTASAAFIVMVQQFSRLMTLPFWLRALLAGTITGLAAVSVPEVLGIGYDTVNAALLGQITLTTLLMVLIFKSISSAAAVGLGLPVGIIGPTFVIGAALGGALGYLGGYLYPEEPVSLGLYAMLGMAAMMAAVLQAPLAALMAVMELTANHNLILPAMVVIVVATMTTSVVFRQKSVFLSTLDTLGLQYPPTPLTLHLQRASVGAIMNRDVVRLERSTTADSAIEALHDAPRWIAVETAPGKIRCVLNAADLRVYLEQTRQSPETAARPPENPQDFDLLEIPGLRMDVVDIDFRATIAEAQASLRDGDGEALCVRRTSAPMIVSVLGIVTQEDIDNYREETQ